MSVPRPSVTGSASLQSPSPTSPPAICAEYHTLINKSNIFFNGLRDLPQFGPPQQWLPFFQKAFEAFTLLWKFQQDNRAVLEDRVNGVGLNRWELGEMASKIAQLYYHYYLRTSDIVQLFESFTFYEAVRSRGYMNDVCVSNSPATTLQRYEKKLRYLCRFLVVCFLLGRYRAHRSVVQDLAATVADMESFLLSSTVATVAADWTVVLREAKSFVIAEESVCWAFSGMPITTNCWPRTLVDLTDCDSVEGGSEKTFMWRKKVMDKLPPYQLRTALIVSNILKQVKFSELTLDMLRMARALEYDPQRVSRKAGGRQLGAISESGVEYRNPSKHLLYRPSFGQIMVALAESFRYLQRDGVMLLYVSAEGMTESDGNDVSTGVVDVGKGPSGGSTLMPTVDWSRDRSGGLALQQSYSAPSVLETIAKEGKFFGGNFNKTDSISTTQSISDAFAKLYVNGRSRSGSLGVSGWHNSLDVGTCATVGAKSYCGLYPEDLVPFTRKPLFVVVESDNSAAFSSLVAHGSLFRQPVVCLMSPMAQPNAIASIMKGVGNIYTLFLHSPLVALCRLCGSAVIGTSQRNASPSSIGQFECEEEFGSKNDVVSDSDIYNLINHVCTAIEDALVTSADRTVQASVGIVPDDVSGNSNSDNLDPSFCAFLSDDFLRSLVVRHVFCVISLSLHISTQSAGAGNGNNWIPRACPDLPKSVVANDAAVEAVLAAIQGISPKNHNFKKWY